jgi:hypothetical protein
MSRKRSLLVAILLIMSVRLQTDGWNRRNTLKPLKIWGERESNQRKRFLPIPWRHLP